MRRSAAVAIAALGLMMSAVMPATANVRAPDGYQATETRTIAEGVEHVVYEAMALPRVVNVAHVSAGAPVELRTVSSYDAIGAFPRLERTSSMCARVECVVAVNGDFFREQLPVGAVAAAGELFRTPNRKHHQLIVDDGGALRAGPLDWSAKLVATDLTELPIDGVNVDRGKDELVLYTDRFGETTMTNPHGAELVVNIDAPRSGRVLEGHTVLVRLVSFRFAKGDTRIPRGGAVLSGHGRAAEALRALWTRVGNKVAGREALMRIDAKGSVREAIGGTPILLRDGKRWFSNDDNAFVRGRHPRTLVGWNRKGDVWLVTVDGRQPGLSVGMSLSEAAQLMASLGATDAINLDGGGSTTFVVHGQVVNRPSDRLIQRNGLPAIVNVASDARAPHVERPVANALAIVPATSTIASPNPELNISLPTVETVNAPPSRDPDPGSDHTGSLPAIVAQPAPPPPARALPVAAAAVLSIATGVALPFAIRRRRLSR